MKVTVVVMTYTDGTKQVYTAYHGIVRYRRSRHLRSVPIDPSWERTLKNESAYFDVNAKTTVEAGMITVHESPADRLTLAQRFETPEYPAFNWGKPS